MEVRKLGKKSQAKRKFTDKEFRMVIREFEDPDGTFNGDFIHAVPRPPSIPLMAMDRS